MNQRKKLYICLFLFAILTLGACAPLRITSTISPTLPAGLSDTATPAPLAITPSPVVETPEPFQRYESQPYGFSIRYPTGFRLAEQAAQPGILLWLGMTVPDDLGAPNQYEPALGLIVYENPEQRSLKDWVDSHLGDPPEMGQRPKQAVVFFSPNIENRDPFQGNPALQYESEAWPIRYEKLIMQSGWIIGIYYHRDHPMDYEPAYRELLASLNLFTPALAAATPVLPTPTPIACLDEKVEPQVVPARMEPFEVRFISNGNIWVWGEGIAAQQISSTGDAARFSFSPDGQVIVFERPVGGDQWGIPKMALWLINRDGSGLHRLISAEQFDRLYSEQQNPDAWAANLPTDYRWLSGTHQLTFGVYPAYNALGWGQVATSYWMVDTSTGKLSAWPQAEKIDPYAPHRLVSPDGNRIAIIGRESISLIHADGSFILKNALTYPASNCGESPCWLAPTAVWTTDSRILRVAVWEANVFGEQERFSTWEILADGKPARKLVTFNGMQYDIFLSPNQQYIAFLNPTNPTSNHRELRLAFFDGSRDIIFASGYELWTQGWVPDSIHFVYIQSSEQQPWLASVCGPAEPLLDPADGPASNITWLDASRFLYIQSQMGEHGPLRMGQMRGPVQNIGPDNGKTLYYEIYGDGNP